LWVCRRQKRNIRPAESDDRPPAKSDVRPAGEAADRPPTRASVRSVARSIGGDFKPGICPSPSSVQRRLPIRNCSCGQRDKFAYDSCPPASGEQLSPLVHSLHSRCRLCDDHRIGQFAGARCRACPSNLEESGTRRSKRAPRETGQRFSGSGHGRTLEGFREILNLHAHEYLRSRLGVPPDAKSR